MKQKRKNNKKISKNQMLDFGKINKIDRHLAKMTRKIKKEDLNY